MVKCAIVGATGYVGAELCRLLTAHPQAEVTGVSSVSFEGQRLCDVYPSLRGTLELPLTDEDTAIRGSDVVFAAVPHGLSEALAGKVLGQGAAFIDMGADFRLEKEADYTQWYGGRYENPALHAQAVYGLPELFRDEIRRTRLIANPGCYPTSVALALAPAIRRGLIQTRHLVIDAKSGTTGAGRGLAQNTHFPDCNEGFGPYKTAQHRHTPEIEQTLSRLAGSPVSVTFVPHLLPINRGIISTIYAPLAKPLPQDAAVALYREFYAGERFVRVLGSGETANLRQVRCSNFCDISVHVDARTDTLVLVSAIDNMVKGAAGQAVQNMNLLFSLPEETGLTAAPAPF